MEESEPSTRSVASVGSYVPYVPAVAKTLLITGSWGLPLLTEEAGGPKHPAVYTIDGIKIAATLRLSDVDDPNGDRFVEVPLAMCKYLSPTPENIYNTEVCREATMKNAAREQHNVFIGKVITAFFKEHGCGSSCGTMTLPPAPEDWVKRRVQELKKFKADKLACAKKAIEYLAGVGIYCGRDYDFDEAFERANDDSFDRECKRRAEGGKVRVRLEGRAPSWWDGVSPQDSSGAYVKWVRGEGHTFMTPDISVERGAAPAVTHPGDLVEEEEEEDPKSNPFEQVFDMNTDAKRLAWDFQSADEYTPCDD